MKWARVNHSQNRSSREVSQKIFFTTLFPCVNFIRYKGNITIMSCGSNTCTSSGLLCCSSELGFEEVYDWMVINWSQNFINLFRYFFPLFYPLLIFLLINMNCSVVLFPVAVTFFITWWFIQFVDGFFSPIYERLGIEIFGKSSLLVWEGTCCLCHFVVWNFIYEMPM